MPAWVSADDFGCDGIAFDVERVDTANSYDPVTATFSFGCMIRWLDENLFGGAKLAEFRSIVANAGVLLTRVLYLKPTAHKNFAVVDAAMNDLIRPAIYDAFHEIRPAREPAADAPHPVHPRRRGHYRAEPRP